MPPRSRGLSPPGALKCTVLGYGIETTPEHATFANGCLIRMVDFNDNAEGGHTSTLIPVALAFGEALHSTGQQVMAAIVVGYEVASAPAGGESVIAAMVAGKLMGLDEDRLANALTHRADAARRVEQGSRRAVDVEGDTERGIREVRCLGRDTRSRRYDGSSAAV